MKLCSIVHPRALVQWSLQERNHNNSIILPLALAGRSIEVWIYHPFCPGIILIPLHLHIIIQIECSNLFSGTNEGLFRIFQMANLYPMCWRFYVLMRTKASDQQFINWSINSARSFWASYRCCLLSMKCYFFRMWWALHYDDDGDELCSYFYCWAVVWDSFATHVSDCRLIYLHMILLCHPWVWALEILILQAMYRHCIEQCTLQSKLKQRL